MNQFTFHECRVAKMLLFSTLTPEIFLYLNFPDFLILIFLFKTLLASRPLLFSLQPAKGRRLRLCLLLVDLKVNLWLRNARVVVSVLTLYLFLMITPLDVCKEIVSIDIKQTYFQKPVKSNTFVCFF